MDTILTNPQMVVEDRQRHLFRVSRRAFTDQSVLDAENRNIFDRCWLYLGHSSEIANNCDFITRNVGGRERRRRSVLRREPPPRDAPRPGCCVSLRIGRCSVVAAAWRRTSSARGPRREG